MKKGEYGHINELKSIKVKLAAIFIGVIAVLSTVILVVCGTRSNYWVIVPIILSLPFAKFMVDYVLVRPFSSMKREDYDFLSNSIQNYEDIQVIYDVTLTSEKGISYMDFILLYDGNVYACVSACKQKFSAQDVEKYLKRIMKGAGYDRQLYVYTDMKDALNTCLKHATGHKEDYVADIKATKNMGSAILSMGV